jgi:hypothetical protein
MTYYGETELRPRPFRQSYLRYHYASDAPKCDWERALKSYIGIRYRNLQMQGKSWTSRFDYVLWRNLRQCTITSFSKFLLCVILPPACVVHATRGYLLSIVPIHLDRHVP